MILEFLFLSSFYCLSWYIRLAPTIVRETWKINPSYQTEEWKREANWSALGHLFEKTYLRSHMNIRKTMGPVSNNCILNCFLVMRISFYGTNHNVLLNPQMAKMDAEVGQLQLISPWWDQTYRCSYIGTAWMGYPRLSKQFYSLIQSIPTIWHTLESAHSKVDKMLEEDNIRENIKS